jgi:hypothetical protein
MNRRKTDVRKLPQLFRLKIPLGYEGIFAEEAKELKKLNGQVCVLKSLHYVFVDFFGREIDGYPHYYIPRSWLEEL